MNVDDASKKAQGGAFFFCASIIIYLFFYLDETGVAMTPGGVVRYLSLLEICSVVAPTH